MSSRVLGWLERAVVWLVGLTLAAVAVSLVRYGGVPSWLVP